jgi:hypothetical protein
MSSQKQRAHTYTPRGPKSYQALKLIGLLGFATVRQLCLTVWENERTTNDNLNRLVEEHYLHQAFEAIDLAEGRGNRLVFLTRTGMTWVLQKGHVREEDIAYLEQLLRESRHLEVRNAAQAQLRLLEKTLRGRS